MKKLWARCNKHILSKCCIICCTCTLKDAFYIKRWSSNLPPNCIVYATFSTQHPKSAFQKQLCVFVSAVRKQRLTAAHSHTQSQWLAGVGLRVLSDNVFNVEPIFLETEKSTEWIVSKVKDTAGMVMWFTSFSCRYRVHSETGDYRPNIWKSDKTFTLNHRDKCSPDKWGW